MGCMAFIIKLADYCRRVHSCRKVNTEDLIRPKIEIGVITQSHNGKVRKLSVNPAIPSIVATVSSEKLVRLWDFKERVLLSTFEIADSSTTIAFSPNGTDMVVGTEKGELLVYSCNALKELVQSFPCAFTANDFSNVQWTVEFRRSLAAKTGKLLCVILSFLFIFN